MFGDDWEVGRDLLSRLGWTDPFRPAFLEGVCTLDRWDRMSVGLANSCACPQQPRSRRSAWGREWFVGSSDPSPIRPDSPCGASAHPVGL